MISAVQQYGNMTICVVPLLLLLEGYLWCSEFTAKHKGKRWLAGARNSSEGGTGSGRRVEAQPKKQRKSSVREGRARQLHISLLPCDSWTRAADCTTTARGSPRREIRKDIAPARSMSASLSLLKLIAHSQQSSSPILKIDI